MSFCTSGFLQAEEKHRAARYRVPTSLGGSAIGIGTDVCLRATSSSRRPTRSCTSANAPSASSHLAGDKPARRKFKSYPIGYFHIDIAEVRTEQGKLHMFVAIDRTSKFAFIELHEKATTAVSRDFLLRLIAAVPYKIHTVLTDNVLRQEVWHLDRQQISIR